MYDRSIISASDKELQTPASQQSFILTFSIVQLPRERERMCAVSNAAWGYLKISVAPLLRFIRDKKERELLYFSWERTGKGRRGKVRRVEERYLGMQ